MDPSRFHVAMLIIPDTWPCCQPPDEYVVIHFPELLFEVLVHVDQLIASGWRTLHLVL
jgi:hypothetical protein